MHVLAQTAALCMAGLPGRYHHPPVPAGIAWPAISRRTAKTRSSRPPVTTSSPGLEAEFDVRNFWIDDLRTGGHMLLPGFGVRPQSLRGTEGFGVLCVRLAPSQPDADGPANALTEARQPRSRQGRRARRIEGRLQAPQHRRSNVGYRRGRVERPAAKTSCLQRFPSFLARTRDPPSTRPLCHSSSADDAATTPSRT